MGVRPLITKGMSAFPAVFHRKGLLPFTRPALQLRSPGLVNIRRMVPPYLPISPNTGITSGSLPTRSATGGSSPASTSCASAGASPWTVTPAASWPMTPFPAGTCISLITSLVTTTVSPGTFTSLVTTTVSPGTFTSLITSLTTTTSTGTSLTTSFSTIIVSPGTLTSLTIVSVSPHAARATAITTIATTRINGLFILLLLLRALSTFGQSRSLFHPTHDLTIPPIPQWIGRMLNNVAPNVKPTSGADVLPTRRTARAANSRYHGCRALTP